jgi:hypothetical protein
LQQLPLLLSLLLLLLSSPPALHVTAATIYSCPLDELLLDDEDDDEDGTQLGAIDTEPESASGALVGAVYGVAAGNAVHEPIAGTVKLVPSKFSGRTSENDCVGGGGGGSAAAMKNA